MRRAASLVLLAAVIAPALAAAAALSCGDPAHTNVVDSLGPEKPGVPPGPTHRPGQPCLACHGGSGPAGAQFSIGGTAYYKQVTADAGLDPSNALVNGTVTLTDAKGKTFSVQTNEVGNFFIRLSQWAPVNPIGGLATDGAVGGVQMPGLPPPTCGHEVQVSGTLLTPMGPGPVTTTCMLSAIGRDGSCADCHFYPAGHTSPGPIYLTQ